jgi:hypothetical protein
MAKALLVQFLTVANLDECCFETGCAIDPVRRHVTVSVSWFTGLVGAVMPAWFSVLALVLGGSLSVGLNRLANWSSSIVWLVLSSTVVFADCCFATML